MRTGLFGQSFQANGARRGEPFQVTSNHAPYGRINAMAGTGGDFAVVWYAYEGGTRAQFFDRAGNPRGADFLVTTQEYWGRDAAMSPAGELVVVWSEYWDRNLNGLRFDSAGNRLGGEFKVPSELVGESPSVAWETGGGFIVAWGTGFFRGDDVLARRFDSAGNAVGGSFRVHAETSGRQLEVDVATAGDGSFVVGWQSGPDQPDLEVFGQRFDRGGARIGAEFQVNRHVVGSQTNPSVVGIGSRLPLTLGEPRAGRLRRRSHRTGRRQQWAARA